MWPFWLMLLCLRVVYDHVYTIEIVPELFEFMQMKLESAG